MGLPPLAPRWLRWSTLVVLAPLLCALLWWASGGVFNISASLPYGLYHAADDAPRVGRLVSYCLPVDDTSRQAYARGYLSRGRCEGGWVPVLKPIVAMAGDHVRFLEAGVVVNGRRITNSARRRHDPEGRPLPVPQPSQRVLQPGELLLVSNYSSHSFDGRYFGVVPATGVQAVVIPVITWRARSGAMAPAAHATALSLQRGFRNTYGY